MRPTLLPFAATALAGSFGISDFHIMPMPHESITYYNFNVSSFNPPSTTVISTTCTAMTLTPCTVGNVANTTCDFTGFTWNFQQIQEGYMMYFYDIFGHMSSKHFPISSIIQNPGMPSGPPCQYFNTTDHFVMNWF